MKKLLLLTMIALLSFNINAQNISIPDPMFEQALIDNNMDDVLDGFIDQSNVQNKFYLSINNKGINDLTGIEAFTSLKSLSFRENNIQSVSLVNNTLLETVIAAKNNLNNIVLPANSNIKVLDLSENTLASINLNGQSNIERLYVPHNNLTFLNIQDNINIVYLGVGNNSLTSLDVSNNINIENFTFESNNITSIDISNLSNLKLIQGHNNQLNSLDVSNNLNLETIYMYENNISSLHTENNSNLSKLNIYNNDLSYLNIKNGNNLFLNLLSILGNPNLTCVIADDANYTGGVNAFGVDEWQFSNSVTFSETDCTLPRLFVFPNPFRNILRVSPNNRNLNKYKLYNMFGHHVKTGVINNNTMFITGVSTGRYVLRLYNNAGLQETMSVLKSNKVPIRWLDPREVELIPRVPIRRETMPIRER